MSEKERLIDVASAVAAGADVDWEKVVEESVDERERSIVRELRVLANIADSTKEPVPASNGSECAARVETDRPAVWGHLSLLNMIGEGSFASVYRAYDGQLDRDVALKLSRPLGVAGPLDFSRAVKEARLLARVRHPHVVTIFGAACHDDRFGLWMELIEGLTLEEFLKTQGTMSAREAAGIGVDLCHALAAVHRVKLLHQDVKATNVMREEGGRIVLMDFGGGRRIPASHERAVGLVGTPLYLAPEVLAGRKPSVQSDIYSLGVLLYHLVTGSYPVRGADRREIERAHETNQRTSLRDLRPSLPSGFVDLVERALSREPMDRYATAGEFGAALAAIADVPYKPDHVPVSRWKLVAAAAVGVVLLAVLSQVLPERTVSNAPPGMAQRASSATLPSEYGVLAAFYAVRNGERIRLRAGSRVAPGDSLYLSIETSRPVYAYVVNQDDRGQSYLLYPLPGFEPGNPVQAGSMNHLPGSLGGEPHYWKVTSAGGREHFFVYVATERLTDFERQVEALPRAETDRPVENIPLTSEAIGVLRGVGGLAGAGKPAERPDAIGAGLKPLPDAREATTGVWARRITFDNPAR